MTDWLPFAFVLAAGTFTVLGLLLRTLEDAGIEAKASRRAFWGALFATALLYVVYLVQGEAWLWY